MAHILIITLVFAPDGVSTATIVSQLAEDLQSKGHTLSVITTVPHYNIELEARTKQPLYRHWSRFLSRSEYKGISVWHTPVVHKGKAAGGRMLGYLIFNLLGLLIGLFAVGHQDVILVISPPLTSGIIGWLLALAKRSHFIYNVQELYPDVFIQINTLPADALSTRILFSLERFVYLRAHTLTVITEAFRQAIIAKRISDGKIRVIPNFVDIDFIRPGPKSNSLASELKLIDKFVVLYAGNLGMTQSFDTLLEVAQRMRNDEDIRFLIVGDGVQREFIAEQIGSLSLYNVLMLPYQPRSRVPEIYATADLGLVPLMTGTAQTTLPSKLYTIMASGRPALVSVDLDSDIVQTVKEAKCGLVVQPDNTDALEAAIREAFNHKEAIRTLGENGRRYVEAHFSRTAVSDQYHQLINSCRISQL